MRVVPRGMSTALVLLTICEILVTQKKDKSGFEAESWPNPCHRDSSDCFQAQAIRGKSPELSTPSNLI